MRKTLAMIYEGRSVKEATQDNFECYHWYLDEYRNLIGISKDITEIEKDLIDLRYVSVQVADDFEDEQTLLWKSFFDVKSDVQSNDLKPFGDRMQFIFFDNPGLDLSMKRAFKELLHSFQESLHVLFYTKHGVILNFLTEEDERQSLDEVLLAAKEDFALDTVFYKTVEHTIDDDLPSWYDDELAFYWEYQGSNRDFFTHKDVFLNTVLNEISTYDDAVFMRWFSSFFEIETELIDVVKCYLEQGSNVSNVAKLMHMHRNTVMNKMDRFIETTGLDVKRFNEAVVAYLLIKRRELGITVEED